MTDFDGNITSSFSINDILSDGFGSLIAPLKISGQDSILAYTTNGFLTFNYSGKLHSGIMHQKPLIAENKKITMAEGMEQFGKRYLFLNQRFGNIDKRGKNLGHEMRLLAWLNPKTGESEPFISFPETSIFREGNHFFKDDWKPVFLIIEDLIYVIFGKEPVIYVYDTSSPYSQFSSISIDLPEYRYSQTVDPKAPALNYFEMPFTSGKILNIKWHKEKFLIAYFPGMKLPDSQPSSEGKSTLELLKLHREMLSKNPIRLAVVDTLGNIVADFVPKNLELRNMHVRNGELWIPEKPDVKADREFLRLFRVGLMIERVDD